MTRFIEFPLLCGNCHVSQCKSDESFSTCSKQLAIVKQVRWKINWKKKTYNKSKLVDVFLRENIFIWMECSITKGVPFIFLHKHRDVSIDNHLDMRHALESNRRKTVVANNKSTFLETIHTLDVFNSRIGQHAVHFDIEPQYNVPYTYCYHNHKLSI